MAQIVMKLNRFGSLLIVNRRVILARRSVGGRTINMPQKRKQPGLRPEQRFGGQVTIDFLDAVHAYSAELQALGDYPEDIGIAVNAGSFRISIRFGGRNYSVSARQIGGNEVEIVCIPAGVMTHALDDLDRARIGQIVAGWIADLEADIRGGVGSALGVGFIFQGRTGFPMRVGFGQG